MAAACEAAFIKLRRETVNIHMQLHAIQLMKYVPITNRTIKSRQLSMGKRMLQKIHAVWKLGTAIQEFGKLHYRGKINDCYIFKRHINQLRIMRIPKMSHLHQVEIRGGL
jgi:hypothetical protein